MVNITRFNPLQDAFENLLRGVPVWLPNPEPRAEPRAPVPTQFRMDVTENDKEYRVLAELPGVKKEEISITISGNQVAVSAEVKLEKDVKNGETGFAPSAITARSSARSRSVRRSTKRPPKPSTTTACWNSRCRRKPQRQRRGSQCIERRLEHLIVSTVESMWRSEMSNISPHAVES